MSELTLLKEELFGNPDSAISDIKFYPGTVHRQSIDDIAGHALRAWNAIKDGKGRDIDLSV